MDDRGGDQGGGPGDVVDGLVAVAADEGGAGQGVGAQGGRSGHHGGGGHDGGGQQLRLGLSHQDHAGHQGDEGQLKKQNAKLINLKTLIKKMRLYFLASF